MYLLKGFIGSLLFTDNEVGAVSKIGEISKNSLTYSKETGIYEGSGETTTTLYTFKSEEDGVEVPVPTSTLSVVLDIGNYIYEGIINQTFIADRNQISSMINFQFSGIVEDLDIGRIIPFNNTFVPEWISFSLVGLSSNIKVWFSDESFASQYDEAEFLIVPPIDNPNDFFKSSEIVSELVTSYDMTDRLERVAQIKENNPYTFLQGVRVTYTNPLEPTETFQTEWVVVIYGAAGNDTDRIYSELRKWILDNSSYGIAEWVTVLPQLFKTNEFIVIPFWHKFAIPNQTVQAGFNSPVIEVRELSDIVDKVCKGEGYELPTSLNKTIATVSPIRTLAFTATANDLNQEQDKLLNDIFPDYINVSNSSLDFTRMDIKTQEWINRFINMLVLADVENEDLSVPIGYSKVTRENITYVSTIYEGATYLVATRGSVIDALGIDAPYYPEDEDGDCQCSVEDVLVNDHIYNYLNPHEASAEQIGLSNLTSATMILDIIGAVDALSGDIQDIREAIGESNEAGILNNHLSASNPHYNDSSTVELNNVTGQIPITLVQAVVVAQDAL